MNQVGADEVQLAQAHLGHEHGDFIGSVGGRGGCGADEQGTNRNQKQIPQQGVELHSGTWLFSKVRLRGIADAPTAMGSQYPRFGGGAMKKCKVGGVG